MTLGASLVEARMRISTGALIVAVLTMHGQVAQAAAPTEREAKALLALPKGSTSLGRTNDGQLLGAVELPAKGKGYTVLSHALGRHTNYGAAELIAVITRATAAVREAFPGSVLGIGNLGFESGRKIPWSVSHQAGRDADLGMYATTLEGKPVDAGGAMPFHAFDADGLANGPGGRKVKFDLPRNLALLVALAEDREARVQYVFVAAWLKEKLLAAARKAGVKGDTIGRLSELLHQPSDSNPHADHFHVRLFCTVEDRLYGCQNRGPVRAWVDPGDTQHAEVARAVAAILQLTGKGSEALQVRALERLEVMAAASELDAIVGALSSDSKKVRKVALAAVVGLADPRAAEGIVKVLPAVQDPAWAAALFAAIPRLDADGLVPLADKVLAPGGVEALLHSKALRVAGPKVRAAALELLRDHGTKAHVPMLMTLAADKDATVRKAALEALAHRTCQTLKDAKAYRAWHAQASGRSELEWIEDGLGGKKTFGTKGMRTKDGIGRLIKLVDSGKAPVRMCAWRGLVALTGHDEDWRLRSPGRNRKHWQSWWGDNAAASGLP